MTLTNWSLFILFWGVGCFIPGPNVLSCITIAMADGFKRGLFVAMGILAASMVHFTVAGLGLSALLFSSAAMFSVVRLAGTLYLAWMGLNMIFRKSDKGFTAKAAPTTPLKAFRRGFVTSITNPKAVIFHTVAISQFIMPHRSFELQFLTIVATAMVLTATVYSTHCALGSSMARLFATAKRRRVFNRSVGSLYLGSAVLMSMAKNKPA